jgi:cyclopropane fatty-acyl-phospholipid synthase-like methyltransferase
LDLQARIGITKHTGGYPATERLLKLCRMREGSGVLYVGSGIGVGPAHLARTRRARVVVIDISEQMLEWTRIRARRDHVAHLVSTERADVLDLANADLAFLVSAGWFDPAVNRHVSGV